jgi:hypothetical protein
LAHWPCRSAAKAGGRVTGTRGSLTTVLGQPFGATLLLVAAIGLLGYAAWRILQGLFDPDRHGHDWRGLTIRATFVVRGLVHAALGWQAFHLYRGLSGSSGTSEREVATEAFQWPLGDWLVVLAGLGLIGLAGQQVYAAITCRLERNLDVEQMRREAGEWVVGLSRFGVAARALSLRWSDGQWSSPVGFAIRRKSAPQRRHSTRSLVPPHSRRAQNAESDVPVGFNLW